MSAIKMSLPLQRWSINQYLLSDQIEILKTGGGWRGGVGMEVMENIDDLRVSRNKVVINSAQKVSSRVLNSQNMMSVARTSLNFGRWIPFLA